MRFAHQTDGHGAYIGPVECQPDPMSPGEYLLPADAYWDAPPTQDAYAWYRAQGGWCSMAMNDTPPQEFQSLYSGHLETTKKIAQTLLTRREVVELGQFCFDLLKT